LELPRKVFDVSGIFSSALKQPCPRFSLPLWTGLRTTDIPRIYRKENVFNNISFFIVIGFK
jgi:hypothetical protein